MTIKVTLISKETIKPSSPTPQHLKTHKLSFLDQLHPTIYSHVMLFYAIEKNPNNDDTNITDVTVNRLKKSLSKALTLFYPLAGRFADDILSIDCNDEGLYFSETRVNCNIMDFLRNPDLDLLSNFYPCHPNNIEPFTNTHPAMVQVNVFDDCSGLAIGLNFSHKFGDGISFRSFLKGWASCSAGDDAIDNVIPSFAAASIFTPCKDLPTESIASLGRSFIKIGTPTTRRFHFDASSIKTLKSKVETDSRVPFFSRVEVVTAFIWKHAMKASEAGTGYRKTSILSHAVDLRRRMVPPLGEFSMGNLLWIPSTVSEDRELSTLVRKLRETFTKVDGELVKKLVEGEGLEVVSENVKEMGEVCSKGEVDYYGFTTWSKYGLYEADFDFGWGRPVWISSHKIGGPVFTNMAFLLETRDGDGLEVWVTLDEKEMELLLGDEEFLALVTVDPSPIA